MNSNSKLGGGAVANVVKVLALLVDIGLDPVRVRAQHIRKTDIGKAPCTEGAPIVRQDLSGRPAM